MNFFVNKYNKQDIKKLYIYIKNKANNFNKPKFDKTL